MADETDPTISSRRAMRRARRRGAFQLAVIRLIGTAVTIGIGIGLGALLASQDVQGWITGLVVSGVTAVLMFVLWVALRQR